MHGVSAWKSPALLLLEPLHVEFISNPSSERFYGEQNDRMPAYLEEGILNQEQISLIVDWLRGQ
jgi:hypothetical protein